MPKNSQKKKKTKRKGEVSLENQYLKEVMSHYQDWTDDMKIRLTRKNGWNDVTDAFWGKLPDDWPYITRIVDPRVRTTIIEKNARLLNSKLRGKLVPREGADAVSAAINNAVLDFQWDAANKGGSMLTKLAICDQDARLYGSKFVLVPWVEEKDEDGNVTFAGNEMKPLDIRDCGVDFSATHIRDAKWFQLREWVFVEDMEKELDADGNPMWKNMDKLKSSLHDLHRQSRRDTEWHSRIKQLKNLQDRVGTDVAFPVIERVTEFREDKWITFSPETNIIFKVSDNPYDHGKIPVSQLRYYPLQDDALGESEVESVLPLWKAIQAILCSYMDEVILKMRPPLKVIEGAARVETLVRDPDAQWLMNSPDAVTEVESRGDSVRYFQTTYPALVSAFNVAMGDLSQGISNIDSTKTEKTATEIRQVAQQQNTRDEKNQTDLADFLKDIMMMWLANNKQFLFRDPDKSEFVLKIVGQDNYNVLKQAGLDDMEVTPEAMEEISAIIESSGGDMTDGDLNELLEAAKTPKFPIEDEDGGYKPKMKVSENGNVADIVIVPEDMSGFFDYVPDVKSMALGAGEELSLARQRAMQSFTSPVILETLAQEGWRPKFKEIISSDLESSGLSGAERFFEKIEGGMNVQPQQGGAIARGVSASGGSPQTPQVGGVSELPSATPQTGPNQQMGQPV